MANPTKGNPNPGKSGKQQQKPQTQPGKQYVQGQTQTGRTNPNTGTTGSWE